MKTLIIYASRHGFTRRCVELLRESLDNQPDLHNLAQGHAPDLTGYDQIVLGGPVYGGHLLPSLLTFVRTKTSELLAKPLYLFVTSLSAKATAKAYLAGDLPSDLLAHARRKAAFGGGVTQKDLSLFERWDVHLTKGIREDVSNLDIHEIAALAADLQNKREN